MKKVRKTAEKKKSHRAGQVKSEFCPTKQCKKWVAYTRNNSGHCITYPNYGQGFKFCKTCPGFIITTLN